MRCISLSNVSFHFPGADDLFIGLSAVFHANQTVAIIGDNGCGKTTLMKIIADELEPNTGRVIRNASVYLMPQMSAPTAQSGGEHQANVLSAAFASGADILLLDEPTNNLDADARRRFVANMWAWGGGVVLVSHDRDLLNQMDCIWELGHDGLRVYGGNYDFYLAAKAAEREVLESRLSNTENRIASLNQSINIAQTTRQHHEIKQRKEIDNKRRSRIAANALKGKSQETEAKKRQAIQKKLNEQTAQKQQISEALRDDKIKIPMPDRPMFKNDLIKIKNMTFGYSARPIFTNFNFEMRGGGRVHLIGKNGAGKSTLIKLILGQLMPDAGDVHLMGRAAYLDQTLSLLNPNMSVVDNIMAITDLKQTDAYAIAANFGFRNENARKRVGTLSGGELLKATLAAVLGGDKCPDLLILDEPTNNLDLKSIAILENVLNQYRGAILLVSHDASFVRNLNIVDRVEL